MNREEFINSQKDCADMLGMSLSEYEDYCKVIKVSEPDETEINDNKYDNDILKGLGLTPKDLKVKKG